MRICFTDYHALGDAAENLIAIYDFHKTNPDVKVCYRGFGEEFFYNQPWIDWSITKENADQVVQITMDLINNSGRNGIHFVRAIEHDITKKTGLPIEPGSLVLPIAFSQEEINDSRIFEENNIRGNYWIINAGGKPDCPTKHYPLEYFQTIVDLTKDKIQWVQIGLPEHQFGKLDGVISLVGKTNSFRDLFKIMYRSVGVLTIMSAPMHLAAMPCFGTNRPRPCVVLGGGREPQSLSLYPNHHWFSSIGTLDCAATGCWRWRVNDNNNGTPCSHPVNFGGQCVAKCMADIAPWKVAMKCLELASYKIR